MTSKNANPASDGGARKEADHPGGSITSTNSQPQNQKQGVLSGRRPDGLTLRPYLLAEIRCAVLRARIAADDLVAIGLALRGGLITSAQALDLIDDCDALRFVVPTRPEPAS
jgi:hypothetical protein